MPQYHPRDELCDHLDPRAIVEAAHTINFQSPATTIERDEPTSDDLGAGGRPADKFHVCAGVADVLDRRISMLSSAGDSHAIARRPRGKAGLDALIAPAIQTLRQEESARAPQAIYCYVIGHGTTVPRIVCHPAEGPAGAVARLRRLPPACRLTTAPAPPRS